MNAGWNFDASRTGFSILSGPIAVAVRQSRLIDHALPEPHPVRFLQHLDSLLLMGLILLQRMHVLLDMNATSQGEHQQRGGTMNQRAQKPSGAFVGASWAALFAGSITYLAGLWNASMQLNEKGYYFALLLYGLFSAVSLQKSVRDRLEGVAVSGLYFSLCWVSLGTAITLLVVGLWNASLSPSEKGFYAMSFLLSMYAAIAVQKNVRDIAMFGADEPNALERSE